MMRPSITKQRSVAALAFGLLLVLCTCIRRAPSASPEQAGPLTTNAKETASMQTGKYGQVAGAQLVEGGLEAFKPQGKVERARLSSVKVTHQPFDRALRVEILQPSQQAWDLQVAARNARPVEAGDVLLATFYFRTERSRDESSEGRTEFVFERAREPWDKSVSYPARASRDWKKIHVPFKADTGLGAFEAQIIFRLGYEPQTVEIGGVSVENFGKQLTLADLPVTRITYPGMEVDAPWRAQAEQRIDRIRKSDLTIRVEDSVGKAVPGAQVNARLVRHAFGFGTCVPAEIILDPKQERFRALVPELFNIATLENDLKWQPLAGDWGPGFTLERAELAMNWLRAEGLDVRGHVLVWPGWRNLPKALKTFENDPVTLRAEVKKHVRALATRTRGKLVHWDVMNEPFDNHDLMDILGNQVMAEWFKEARAADPAAKLFINDYAILSGGGGTTAHRDHYETTIRLLLEQGAPLDGIGLQGHFGTSLTSPEDLLTLLDRYAKFGKTLWVTEYDIVIDDEALAGQYTRDFYTTLFSHPAVGGIVMWGFWDASHWKKNAALYRSDWSLKPAGQVYRDLVLGKFRTEESGVTNEAGVFETRGFLGDYEVTASVSGKQKTRKSSVKPGRSTISVRFD